ncbi:hypothetical protein BY458DRAFT_548999 [Sporodiniella umbellata]|nr:hypothetical protein BY458DRAFT_548999 [Sporodiniella umbellata]
MFVIFLAKEKGDGYILSLPSIPQPMIISSCPSDCTLGKDEFLVDESKKLRNSQTDLAMAMTVEITKSMLLVLSRLLSEIANDSFNFSIHNLQSLFWILSFIPQKLASYLFYSRVVVVQSSASIPCVIFIPLCNYVQTLLYETPLTMMSGPIGGEKKKKLISNYEDVVQAVYS